MTSHCKVWNCSVSEIESCSIDDGVFQETALGPISKIPNSPENAGNSLSEEWRCDANLLITANIFVSSFCALFGHDPLCMAKSNM